MSQFTLGRCTVNRLGYGAMRLAGPGVFGPPSDPSEAMAVLRSAVETGVNHIDTAQYYGPDVVNDLIRQALYPYAPGLAIVTKVGVRRDSDGRIILYNHPDDLRQGIVDNLASLRVEQPPVQCGAGRPAGDGGGRAPRRYVSPDRSGLGA